MLYCIRVNESQQSETSKYTTSVRVELALEGRELVRQSSSSHQLIWDLDFEAVSCAKGGRKETGRTYTTSL